MTTVAHKIVLKSDQQLHGKLPPRPVGLLLAELPLIVRQAVSMALRSRSTARGPSPDWLKRAADVRFVGHETNGDTALWFEAPRLGDTGEKVTGVFSEDQVDCMHKLWRARVLVLGTAIYRASGKLLRIDAEAVKPGEHEPALFSRMPAPSHVKLDVSKLRKTQGPRSGMAAIMGQWPGDETDEEVADALERLS